MRTYSSLALMALTICACTSDKNDKDWTVSIRGYGPIRAGMTLDEATTAGGRPLTQPGAGLEECDFVGFAGDTTRSVQFMVIGGRIKRVDINDSTIATAHDIRIGAEESRVQQAYPGRVKVEPHKYEEGHYLMVGPGAAADSGFELVFETDGQRVTRYRAGQVPEVELVEGCS